MSRVTCAEYLAMPAPRVAEFSAWMSGWFNQKTGYVFVDLNAYARNVANVKSWCTSNPNATVMAGLQRRETPPPQLPGEAGVAGVGVRQILARRLARRAGVGRRQQQADGKADQ